MNPVYHKLARHLDDLPGGYPATENGVELRILERLFTPQDAALALGVDLIVHSATKYLGGHSDLLGGAVAENLTFTRTLFNADRAAEFNTEELFDLIELEVRELLDKYEFPGDDIPVIRGSALKALESDDPDAAEAKCVFELMDAIDSFIPEPQRDVDKPFLMPIEDVFSISGRGTVVTGRVERGVINVGDEIEIVGIRDTKKTTCTGVEMFRKLLDRGEAGDNVGLLLRGT